MSGKNFRFVFCLLQIMNKFYVVTFMFSFIIIIMYNTGQLTVHFLEVGRGNWKAFCTLPHDLTSGSGFATVSL